MPAGQSLSLSLAGGLLLLTDMPQPKPPPTPGSSSDIRGKEGYLGGPALHLPTTAYQEQIDPTNTSSATLSINGSDSSHSSYRPVSPVDVGRKRPAPSGSVITKDDFALPPPPTRSRKIIQMKPKDSEQQAQPGVAAKLSTVGETSPTAKPGNKRKSANTGTTAAGRKIARKTAHSLIERRRRSKMNEEFGVLKDMIPACQGQEMHKLAILQASIEYLRYLENCVADLKTQTSFPNSRRQAPPPPTHQSQTETVGDDEVEDEEMEDDDHETGEGASTPATASVAQSNNSIVSLPSLSQITTTTTTSPSIFSVEAGSHYSVSSAASSYSPYVHSNQASPAFEPQLRHVAAPPSFGNTFGLGSPALKPVDSHLRQIAEGATELSEAQRLASRESRSEKELDQEATAALLMLNHDRRNWRSAQHEHEPTRSSTGGMSVRDLLSN